MFDDIYVNRVLSKVQSILKDSSHPLKDFYKVLPSGKRLRCLACKTARFYNSLVPTSVVLYNNSQPNIINM